MFKLKGSPKTETVTKALAERFANMEPCPKDRPMSDVRLRVYDKEWVEGRMRPVSRAAAFCRETGGTYRVNGKHTSTLASTVDLKTYLPLIAVTELYECDTLDDVARLYSTYDSRMQSRNSTDINRAFAACVPQLSDVGVQMLNACVSGYWYSFYQDRYASSTTPQERAEMLVDHHDFVVWVSKLVHKEKEHNFLRRAAVIGAMYQTRDKAPVIAQKFWEAVRDETDPYPKDPTRKLARFLLLNWTRRTNTGKDKNVTNREFFIRCLQSWNAFRKDEEAPIIYRQNTPIPRIA